MYKKLINKRMYNKFKIDKRVNNFSNIFIKDSSFVVHSYHHDSTKSDVTKCNTSV